MTTPSVAPSPGASLARVPHPRSAAARYGASLAVWLLALGATLAVQSYVQRSSFIFFWVAVLFAAWYAGLVPALCAAVASVLAVNYFLVPPVHDLRPPATADLLMLVIFVLVATLVSLLASRLAAARHRLAQEALELAGVARQLQERTTELERRTEAAQVLAEELEMMNEELERAAVEAEAARADAEAANRAKSEFLATMSHELRTPINAAVGYVELLELGLRGPVSDEQRDDLRRIRRSQERLLSLVDDLLGFTHLESGRIEYALEDVPLHETLARAEELIRPQALAKGIVVESPPVRPTVEVRADRVRLEQIVVNLLTNAVKFTPAGGRIVVDAGVADHLVHVRVRDSGRGIPVDQLERIFEPFVQVERGLTRAAGGLGLGLTISRRLARAMGGELAAASAPGSGSTFTLTLERARSRARASA